MSGYSTTTGQSPAEPVASPARGDSACACGLLRKLMSPNQVWAVSPVLSVSVATMMALIGGASSPKAARKSSATLRSMSTHWPSRALPDSDDDHAHAVGVGAPLAVADRLARLPDVAQGRRGQLVAPQRTRHAHLHALAKRQPRDVVVEDHIDARRVIVAGLGRGYRTSRSDVRYASGTSATVCAVGSARSAYARADAEPFERASSTVRPSTVDNRYCVSCLPLARRYGLPARRQRIAGRIAPRNARLRDSVRIGSHDVRTQQGEANQERTHGLRFHRAAPGIARADAADLPAGRHPTASAGSSSESR